MALLKALAALEEFDTDLETTSEPDSIAEATEVESSLIEAQENEEELNDMEADMEVAEDAEEALEELIVSLEEAVERGGMDRHEARLYNLNRKTIYGMMGHELDSHRQVAVESFEGASSRLTATKIALEEEKGTMKKWWEAIVRFIKQAAAKVVDFVIGIFSTIQALQNRAQSLLKAANESGAKFEGKLKDSQKEKYGRIFRGPGIEEKVGTIDDILGHLSKQISNGNGLPKATSNINGVGKEMKDYLINVIKKNNNLTGSDIIGRGALVIREQSLYNAIEVWNGEAAKDQELEKIKAAEGSTDSNTEIKYKIHTRCYGGYLLVSKTITKKIDDKSPQADGAADVSASMAFINAGKFEDKKELKYDEEELTAEKCKKALKDIIGHCKDLRKIGDYIKDFNKAFQKQSEDMSSKASSITEKAMRGVRKIGSMLKSLFTTSNGLSKWYKYLITLCKDVLNVISIRMSNAPGEDKEEKKEDDKPADDKPASTPAA